MGDLNPSSATVAGAAAATATAPAALATGMSAAPTPAAPGAATPPAATAIEVPTPPAAPDGSAPAAKPDAVTAAPGAPAAPAVDDPLLVKMVTATVFANPRTNSKRRDGAVLEGETITVDPFYAQDLELAGLAKPTSAEHLARALKAAGERPPVHGGGVRVTRTKA